jgi:hypothetical protein
MSFYINKKGYTEGAQPLTVKALKASGLNAFDLYTKPIPRTANFRMVFATACVAMLRLTGQKATTAEVKAGEWDHALILTKYHRGGPITKWKVLVDDEHVSIIEA